MQFMTDLFLIVYRVSDARRIHSFFSSYKAAELCLTELIDSGLVPLDCKPSIESVTCRCTVDVQNWIDNRKRKRSFSDDDLPF